MPARMILVTGAGGFVGRHLCRYLADAGYRVRGTVRADPPAAQDGIEYLASGDIGGDIDWRPMLDGVEAVVHAAARVHVQRETDPDPWSSFRRGNVVATESLARQAAAAGVRRLVFLSSIKASEVARAAPNVSGFQPYEVSKWEAEQALARVARETPIETVILRPPLVYGPGAAANFALLAGAVAAGWPLPLASLRNRRSFLYVGNLCAAVAACLEHPGAVGQTFEVSDGPPLSTPEFVRAIGRALGRPVRLLPCPAGLLRRAGRLLGRAAAADSLTGDLVADDRAIRGRLGWSPPWDTDAGLCVSLARAAPGGRQGATRGMFGRALSISVFAIYRGVAVAATPLVRGLLRRRQARGREDPARLGERLGHAGAARPQGPLLWIHAASVGESLSALPLIEQVRARWPALGILMTTGTVTSARLMVERLPAGVIHQYGPVDLPGAVGRFLDHWRPALGIVIESELWPNLLRQAHAKGIELALVNGRMSARSYAAWRRVRPLIGHLLGLFSVVLAQSREDLRHLRALGAGQARRLGNLKFVAPPLAADPAELSRLRGMLGGRPRWAAASTHPGEEELVAEAHAAVAATHPGLLTILAPRHPDRGAEIAALLAARGLRVARRAAGQAIAPDTDVYLADTLGELGLWYRLAEVVFVGRSLVPKGGQNVLEPAKLGCAILSGPHTANFLRVSHEMTEAGALHRVMDGADLAREVAALLDDAPARRVMIAAAADYAASEAGALDDIIAALAPALDRAAASNP